LEVAVVGFGRAADEVWAPTRVLRAARVVKRVVVKCILSVRGVFAGSRCC